MTLPLCPNGVSKGVFAGAPAFNQALVYFKWANYCCGASPLPPLFINMDETSLAYAFPYVKGTVVCRKHLPAGARIKPQRLTTNELRGHVTYMSFICNESVLQPLLPQILIGNEHFFTLTKLQEVTGLPGNILLWREKSAWSNHVLIRRAITTLHRCLYHSDLRWSRNVILVMDVHKSHYHRTISVLARRYGFQLMYAMALVA